MGDQEQRLYTHDVIRTAVDHKESGLNRSADLWSRIHGAAWTALRNWFNHGAQRKGASIAFYAIFALAPLLLLVIVIAGVAFGDEAARGYVVGQLRGLVGQQSARPSRAGPQPSARAARRWVPVLGLGSWSSCQ